MFQSIKASCLPIAAVFVVAVVGCSSNSPTNETTPDDGASLGKSSQKLCSDCHTACWETHCDSGASACRQPDYDSCNAQCDAYWGGEDCGFETQCIDHGLWGVHTCYDRCTGAARTTKEFTGQGCQLGGTGGGSCLGDGAPCNSGGSCCSGKCGFLGYNQCYSN